MTSLASRMADRFKIARSVAAQAKQEHVGGFISDRLRIFRSVITRSPVVERVNTLDGLSQVVKWYRFQRVKILKDVTISELDDSFLWVDVSPLYGLAWPREGNLSRLGAGLVELWCPSNPHYYFIPFTRVKPGDVVVDVGCSEGAFALDCLKRFQASEVWCFEPSPRMANGLRITAERNGLQDRMRVVDAAVSDTSGIVEFYENPADPLGGRPPPFPTRRSRRAETPSSAECRKSRSTTGHGSTASRSWIISRSTPKALISRSSKAQGRHFNAGVQRLS